MERRKHHLWWTTGKLTGADSFCGKCFLFLSPLPGLDSMWFIKWPSRRAEILIVRPHRKCKFTQTSVPLPKLQGDRVIVMKYSPTHCSSGLPQQPLASWLLPRWSGGSLAPVHSVQNNSEVTVAKPWQEEWITHCSLSSFHTVLPNLVGQPSSCVHSSCTSLPSDTVPWDTAPRSSFLVSSVSWWWNWEVVIFFLLLCLDPTTPSGPRHQPVSWSVLIKGRLWIPCIFKLQQAFEVSKFVLLSLWGSSLILFLVFPMIHSALC